MWLQTETDFLYFYKSEYSVINNNSLSRRFNKSFTVSSEDKFRWSTSGRSLHLAPEVLTYWSKEE